MGYVYICYVFGQLSSVKRLNAITISVVMLLGYRIAGISRKLESVRKEYALCPNAAYLIS